MESVIIEVLDTKKYHNEIENLFFSKFFSFKRIIPIFIYLFIGIILFTNGILSEYDFKRITSTEGQEKVTLFNYGIHLGIGLGLLLFSLLQLIAVWKSRNIYKTAYKFKENKFTQHNSSLKFILTNTHIELTSDLVNWSKKWEYFDFFKTTTSYLELYSYSYNKKIPEVFIPIASLNEEEKTAVKKYLSNKFFNNI